MSGQVEVAATGPPVSSTPEHNALQQSREEFRLAFDHAPIGMAIVDLQGKFVRVNPALCRITGYPADVLQSLTFKDITHPDDLGRDVELFDSLMKDSADFYEVDKRYIRPDNTQVWIHLTACIVRTDEGTPIHFVAQVLDITERKSREEDLQRLSEQLEQSNRELGRSNADLAEFAAVVAHDLKAPLQSFYLNVDRLADTALDPSQHVLIEQLIGATGWMALLVDGVLAYCQADRQPIYTEVDLNTSIARVLSNLEAEMAAVSGKVEAENLPTVHADQMQLQQLFQNLISNALKSARTDVPARVRIECRQTASGWEGSVADNGVGIPADVREQVFDIFVRVRRRTSGRSEVPGHGIGLATCRRIVERHRGRIWVDENYSEGARICFEFPQAPSELN